MLLTFSGQVWIWVTIGREKTQGPPPPPPELSPKLLKLKLETGDDLVRLYKFSMGHYRSFNFCKVNFDKEKTIDYLA